ALRCSRVTRSISHVYAFPDVSQNEPWGADDIGAPRLPRGQSDHPNRGIRQCDPRLDRRPAKDGRALEAEEDQHASEEALGAGALAQLLGGPGGWQAVAPLLSLRVPWNDSVCVQRGVYPGDEREAPVASI